MKQVVFVKICKNIFVYVFLKWLREREGGGGGREGGGERERQRQTDRQTGGSDNSTYGRRKLLWQVRDCGVGLEDAT